MILCRMSVYFEFFVLLHYDILLIFVTSYDIQEYIKQKLQEKKDKI